MRSLLPLHDRSFGKPAVCEERCVLDSTPALHVLVVHMIVLLLRERACTALCCAGGCARSVYVVVCRHSCTLRVESCAAVAAVHTTHNALHTAGAGQHWVQFLKHSDWQSWQYTTAPPPG